MLADRASPRRLARRVYRRALGQRRLWRRALPTEAAFWSAWIASRGMHWPEDFAQRFDPSTPLQESLILDRIDHFDDRRIRILDVGAGPATFVEMVADGRELVVAMEPDPAFAEQLRVRFAGHENVQVVEASTDELTGGVVPAPFDSVVCFNVLEHVKDDSEAVCRLHDVLAPDGRLFLLVPAHPLLFGETDRMLEHERRYEKEPLRRLLAESGYAIQELRHVNPLGALGWLVSARVLRRRHIPAGPLRAFNRLVPVIRLLDAMRLPFGLSLWAVCRRP